MSGSTNSQNLIAYRASIFHFLKDPGMENDVSATEYFEDGILLVDNGLVVKIGPADNLLKQLPEEIPIKDYTGKLIIPGLIDAHIHYPQTDMIASYGEQLLEWLNKYTFPTEGKFEDQDYAEDVAEFFIDELLRNGTTTALVLATIHPGSVNAIFEASRSRGMRMLAGKVMMDRNAPDYLLDTPESAYRDSKDLLEKWHKIDRLLYAITPRFAPTSTDEQLQQAANLAKEYPDAYVHTHVAENKKEVQWVAELFPWSRSYLDVYDHFGLLRERSIFAHCLHLDATDRRRFEKLHDLVTDLPVLGEVLLVVTLGEPPRLPVGGDSQSEPVWIDLLTHQLSSASSAAASSVLSASAASSLFAPGFEKPAASADSTESNQTSALVAL